MTLIFDVDMVSVLSHWHLIGSEIRLRRMEGLVGNSLSVLAVALLELLDELGIIEEF